MVVNKCRIPYSELALISFSSHVIWLWRDDNFCNQMYLYSQTNFMLYDNFFLNLSIFNQGFVTRRFSQQAKASCHATIFQFFQFLSHASTASSPVTERQRQSLDFSQFICWTKAVIPRQFFVCQRHKPNLAQLILDASPKSHQETKGGEHKSLDNYSPLSFSIFFKNLYIYNNERKRSVYIEKKREDTH